MKQLNIAATFAAVTVLTVFALTYWLFDGQPFESPAERIEASEAVRKAEHFGGKFGVRGPGSLDASAWSSDRRILVDSWTPAHMVSQ